MHVPRHLRSAAAVVLLCSLAVCHGDCGTHPQAPLQPGFVGRFVQDPEHPEARLFAWSQSSIIARFSGTRVAVKLQDVQPAAGQNFGPNYYNVSIDDRPATVLPMRDGQTSYTLADALPPGTHTVTIVKRTEASVGTARFSGFDFGPDGYMLPPPPHPQRRLLIIGDSITAGYGIEGSDQNCPFTPATENSDLAYGPLAARAVGAEVHVIAWSGKGVYQNRDGTKDHLVPLLQQRALPEDENSRRDPNDFVPDAIVVNLGTNDFAHDLAPEAPFEQAYASLVTQLHQNYPQAYIVLGLGPMLEDSDKSRHQLTVARHMLQTVLERLQQAGMTKTALLEFPQQHGELGFGCDWHPSRATHAAMGTRLANFLQTTLSW